MTVKLSVSLLPDACEQKHNPPAICQNAQDGKGNAREVPISILYQLFTFIKLGTRQSL
jgi:hypothetical protein